MQKQNQDQNIEAEDNIGATEQEQNDQSQAFAEELFQKLVALKQEAETERQRAQTMEDAAKRLQAEFDNYRKRNNDAVKKAKDEGIEQVISSLLPITDVIEQAISMITDQKVAEGVKIIHRQFTDLLASYDVEAINPVGEDFDPNLCDAVSAKKAEGIESGKIAEVLRKGYARCGKILRHASVIIAE